MVAPSWIQQVRLASVLTVVAGLWEVAAPFVLGYLALPTPAINAVIVGGAIAILSAVRWVAPLNTVWLSWATVVLGLWLVVAPFVLGYDIHSAPTSNDVGIGIIVASLATWSALATVWAPCG